MDVRVSAGDDVLRTWTYELAKIDAPLSSNDRVHWAPARKQHADLRWQARTLTVSATGGRRFRKNPFDFELIIHPPDKRVRDSDNYIQHVLKPVKDGIADALKLEDDSDARIGWSIKLGEPTGKRYWRYVITLREREA